MGHALGMFLELREVICCTQEPSCGGGSGQELEDGEAGEFERQTRLLFQPIIHSAPLFFSCQPSSKEVICLHPFEGLGETRWQQSVHQTKSLRKAILNTFYPNVIVYMMVL